MKLKQDSQLAYVIHSRPFRETSLLVDMLCLEHGRIAVVARGAKRGNFKISSILQPFIPLHVGWHGTGELVTLTQSEVAGQAHHLQAKRSICGLYMNELLFKLLNKWDPCANLFNNYKNSLENLAQPQVSEQAVLRNFEKEFLRSLGYGLQLTTEIESGDPVVASKYYKFDPVLGPRLVEDTHVAAIRGATLLALENNEFTCQSAMADIKRLMRMVFSYHLGARAIVTRQLL